MESFSALAYWYDWGFRRGVFTRCNGLERPNRTDWNYAARDGFTDGYNANERRI